jgi:hypothetical protein
MFKLKKPRNYIALLQRLLRLGRRFRAYWTFEASASNAANWNGETNQGREAGRHISILAIRPTRPRTESP